MKALKNKVIFKMDTRQKEKYALTEDVSIEISRGFEFNLRLDRPSMAYCIDGDGIPFNAKLLVHHLSSEASNEVPYAHEYLTEKEMQEGFKIFTIEKDSIFCYFHEGEWHPYINFLITKRLYKPYEGPLTGMPNERIPNVLYVVNGKDKWEGEETDLSGKVLIVTPNSDYEIVYHDSDNRPHSLIRTRWRELIAIDEGLTKEVKCGNILVGLDEKNCHPLN